MFAVLFAVPLCATAFATELEPRQRQLSLSAAAPAVVAGFDPAALVPYFPAGPLADAAAEVRDGHGAAALKLLPRELSGAPAHFLRALALAQAAEWSAAAAAFEQVGPTYPAMRARVDCLAAVAFATVGDLEGALRHEAGCADDPVRGKVAKVEHARLLARLGRRDEAVQELEVLAQLPGMLRGEALFALGLVREEQGRLADALEAWREIYLDDPTNYLADKALVKAREVARRAKASAAAPARLADRADKLLQAGSAHLKAAIAQLADLVPVVPKVCETTCEVKRCSGAPLKAPGLALPPAPAAAPPASIALSPEPGPDESLVEVPELTDKPAPASAPFELAKAKDDELLSPQPALPLCAVETVLAPADPLGCRVQLLRGIAARKTRANQKALDLLRVVYERCADPDVRARAAYTAATAAAALRDPDAAPLAALAAFQFNGHALIDDALLAAAGLARDRGDRPAERAALRRLVSVHPDSDQRAEALFRLFWSHRAQGRPERGLGYLETLWKEYDAGPRGDGGDAERGRYWWGRTVAQNAVAADRPRGVLALATLSRERPMTYYGLLAGAFAASVDPSADLQPTKVAPLEGLLHEGLLAQDRGFAIALESLRMGLTKDARDALVAVDFRPLRADGRRGREATLLVLEMLRGLGDDRTAHGLARRELLRSMRDATDPLARRASLVAFPLAFRGEIQEFATKAGFAPNFLQGLMREESALDPNARSPVGARGLTQLMPATARAVAKSIGLKRFNVERLWEPATNIQIGSVYLGRMLHTFGHPGLAAAAYNAGPGAVARWLSTATTVFDEFVEDIPFGETRGYVKRVLRSYAAYQYLYEKEGDRGVKLSLGLRPAPPQTTQDSGLH